MLIAVGAVSQPCTARTNVLEADLAFNFECGKSSPPSEAAIERFLVGRGFEVANEERVRRQLGLGFFPLQIEGLDGRQWTVLFQGLWVPPNPGSDEKKALYTVDIYSPPPTRHDGDVESATIAFVSETLACKITSLNRSDNAQESRDLFGRLLAMQKGRMHEAEVCDRTEKSYDAGRCSRVPRP